MNVLLLSQRNVLGQDQSFLEKFWINKFIYAMGSDNVDKILVEISAKEHTRSSSICKSSLHHVRTARWDRGILSVLVGSVDPC